jgi:hypothetical protein
MREQLFMSIGILQLKRQRTGKYTIFRCIYLNNDWHFVVSFPWKHLPECEFSNLAT